MKLKFLGSGSAFCHHKENYQSHVLVTIGDQRMLLDCGGDVKNSVPDAGLTFRDINAVYVSHLHGDHIDGLEWLGYCTFFTRSARPKLYAHTSLIDSLWRDCLVGSMGVINDPQHCDLSTYFRAHRVSDSFEWCGTEFKLVRTPHIIAGGQAVPSFGLVFNTPANKKVFFTSDTQHAPTAYMNMYESSDVIFHDCEVSAYPSGVHAHYDELCTLPAHIKARMWLYHYSTPACPDAVADGFAGFVARGQEFDFS